MEAFSIDSSQVVTLSPFQQKQSTYKDSDFYSTVVEGIRIRTRTQTQPSSSSNTNIQTQNKTIQYLQTTSDKLVRPRSDSFAGRLSEWWHGFLAFIGYGNVLTDKEINTLSRLSQPCCDALLTYIQQRLNPLNGQPDHRLEAIQYATNKHCLINIICAVINGGNDTDPATFVAAIDNKIGEKFLHFNEIYSDPGRAFSPLIDAWDRAHAPSILFVPPTKLIKYGIDPDTGLFIDPVTGVFDNTTRKILNSLEPSGAEKLLGLTQCLQAQGQNSISLNTICKALLEATLTCKLKTNNGVSESKQWHFSEIVDKCPLNKSVTDKVFFLFLSEVMNSLQKQ